MHQGKLYRVSTKTKNPKKARAELRREIAPFLAGEEVATLQSVVGRLTGATAEAARLHDAANPPLRIADTWRKFLQSPRRPDSGARTLQEYESRWARFEEWAGNQKPAPVFLREVTRDHANRYAADLTAARLAPATFNAHRNLLKLVWRCMAEDARTDLNPWEGIQLKRLDALATRKKAVTAAQLESLLASTLADIDLHDLLLLLAWTGLRLVDGVKIRWGAVDFPMGVITLAPQKTARRTGKEVHIPLFPVVRAMLDARQSGQAIAPARPVFPELSRQYELDRGATFSKRITAAFEKAGMTTAENRKGRERKAVVYGAHSLRHFFVTAASAAGVPGFIIKSITGHETDSMLEHYQQIGIGMAGEIAARIANGKPPGPPPEALEIQSADKVPPAVREALKGILAALDNGDIDGARARLKGIIT
jgi:integrase